MGDVCTGSEPAVTAWQTRAACIGADPDLFFPDTGQRANIAAAKRICASCPVRWSCLQAGLGEKYGIWGGYTETERRPIIRQQRRNLETLAHPQRRMTA